MRNFAIEQMLESLKGKSAVEQLRERGIGALQKRRYPDTSNTRGELITSTIDTKGYITIGISARDSFEEWPMTVGHELGHTFEYGLVQADKVVPFKLWPRLKKREVKLLITGVLYLI